MTKQILIVLSIGIFGVPSMGAKPQRMAHPHVHGEMQVDLGVDGDKASIHFEIDTHSLMGFEHAAKTSKEKAIVEKVYKTFRSDIGKMFVFDPKLRCQFEEQKLTLRREEHHGEHKEHDKDHDHDSEKNDKHDKHDKHDKGDKGEHQSLVGDFKVVCAQKMVPGKVNVDLKSSFAEIQKIKVHLVTETKADYVELSGAGEINLK